MNNHEKEKIERIIQERKYANNFYSKKSDVFNKFINMEISAYKDGKLSKKHKELIAIGISIVINCESCMEHHIHEAINDGASEDEIIEA
jgi:AhpD family alkylhydroperoxidase